MHQMLFKIIHPFSDLKLTLIQFGDEIVLIVAIPRKRMP
jgi:hypothetical protein